MKVIVNTSVFIDYSRSKKGLYASLINDAKVHKIELYVPTVVLMEYWTGREMSNKKNIDLAERMFSGISRINLSEDLAKFAGEVSRSNNVQGFDAIIAATALEIGACVATNNKKHFSKIKNLKLYS